MSKTHDHEAYKRLMKQAKPKVDGMARDASFVHAYNHLCRKRWGPLDPEQEARYLKANT